MRHSSIISGLLCCIAAQTMLGCSWLNPTPEGFPSGPGGPSQSVSTNSMQTSSAMAPAGHVASMSEPAGGGSTAAAITNAANNAAEQSSNSLNNLVDGVTSLIPKADDPEARMRRQIAAGRLLVKQGRLQDAERVFGEVVAARPELAAPRQRLGLAIAKQGRYEEAEHHLAEANRLAPNNASVLADLGYLQYLQHRLPEAEQTLRASLSLNPNDKRCLNNLGLVMGGLNRLDESFDVFKRAGSEAEAHANMGYVLAQNGDLKNSQQAYLRALSLDNGLRKAAEAMLQVAAQEQNVLNAAQSPEADAPKKSMSSAIAENLDRVERRRDSLTPRPAPPTFANTPANFHTTTAQQQQLAAGEGHQTSGPYAPPQQSTAVAPAGYLQPPAGSTQPLTEHPINAIPTNNSSVAQAGFVTPTPITPNRGQVVPTNYQGQMGAPAAPQQPRPVMGPPIYTTPHRR